MGLPSIRSIQLCSGAAPWLYSNQCRIGGVVPEGVVPDGLQPGAERDGGQRGATIEGRGSDRGQRVGQRDRRQRRAEVEGGQPNGLQAGAEGGVLELSADRDPSAVSSRMSRGNRGIIVASNVVNPIRRGRL